jgi:hypothetical protein
MFFGSVKASFHRFPSVVENEQNLPKASWRYPTKKSDLA